MAKNRAFHGLDREQHKGELTDLGVLLMEGHFDYGNGFHGQVYVNPHQLLCDPAKLMKFVQLLTDYIPATIKEQVEVVAGPQTGGALIAAYVAVALEAIRPLTKSSVKCVSFEKNDGSYRLRKFNAGLLYDSDLKRGRNVLLVDDVLNTGGTMRECERLVREARGDVVGTAVLVNRNRTATEVTSLVDEFTEDRYPAETCSLCKLKVPITRF